MIAIILGVNTVYFYTFTKLYAEASHFIPQDGKINRIAHIGEDKGILFGGVLTLLGLALSIASLVLWKNTGFSTMNPEELMRFVLPAATMIEIGIETIFASFLMGILKIEWRESYSVQSN